MINCELCAHNAVCKNKNSYDAMVNNIRNDYNIDESINIILECTNFSRLPVTPSINGRPEVSPYARTKHRRPMGSEYIGEASTEIEKTQVYIGDIYRFNGESFDLVVDYTQSPEGRYLCGWNCFIGQPTAKPDELPFKYKEGDYYIVECI